MAQTDAKGGKVPPLLVHMSMHDARFWCATGCTARAAVAADSEVGIAWEGNCRVQEPHPPALWASTFRSRGSLPGKSWFPGERAAAEMHAAVQLPKRWAARMTWGWSTGCEWNLTTCGGEGDEGPPFVCGTTHQWRVRWPPQAGVGAQSRAPMSRQAQVGRGFAVCGGTDV